MSSINEEWKIWREQRTEAFNFLIDYLFETWNMNNENGFRGFKPSDVIFRSYFCAKGVTGYWMNKEVYSFSLDSYFWFNGRVYYENCQLCVDEVDLIDKYTNKISSNGVFVICEDRVICENAFLSSTLQMGARHPTGEGEPYLLL